MQTTEKGPENKDERVPETPGAAEQSEPQEKPDAKPICPPKIWVRDTL